MEEEKREVYGLFKYYNSMNSILASKVSLRRPPFRLETSRSQDTIYTGSYQQVVSESVQVSATQGASEKVDTTVTTFLIGDS